jgi:hypothetical protein
VRMKGCDVRKPRRRREGVVKGEVHEPIAARRGGVATTATASTSCSGRASGRARAPAVGSAGARGAPPRSRRACRRWASPAAAAREG